MIYLDTHVLVWLYAGQIQQFSLEIQNRLSQPDLLISPIVQLELDYLFEIQRIVVSGQEIVSDLGMRLGLQICSQSFLSVVQAARQLDWTRDPFDRLIVAQASLSQAPLVSKDQRIAQYYPHTLW